MDQVLFWLALKHIPGLGNKTALELIEHFERPEAIFGARPEELKGTGLKERVIAEIKKGSWEKAALEEKQRAEREGVSILPFDHPNYSSFLKEIYNPPLLLYVKGKIENLNLVSIAIVGTRRASFYGINMATKLSMELAERGINVVSGLARGIDTAAHKGALKARGKTVAVLGCGVDVIYPPENKSVYESILKNGGSIVSEFPLGTPPLAKNFPLRNRIISGLCLGVVVVEAALRSGSLITARLALEQGREVFAVPGPANNPYSHGTHYLIKQGAKLVETASDILEELPISSPVKLSLFNRASQAPSKTPKNKVNGQIKNTEDPLTERILSFLQTPKHLDEIILHLNQLEETKQTTSAAISAKLTMLEIQGLITQLPGKRYVRADY